MSQDAVLLTINPRDSEETETTVSCRPVVYHLPSDPTADQMMRIIENSDVLDFWDDPAEDIYTLDDGDPV
jgi:hypothetical protein